MRRTRKRGLGIRRTRRRGGAPKRSDEYGVYNTPLINPRLVVNDKKYIRLDVVGDGNCFFYAIYAYMVAMRPYGDLVDLVTCMGYHTDEAIDSFQKFGDIMRAAYNNYYKTDGRDYLKSKLTEVFEIASGDESTLSLILGSYIVSKMKNKTEVNDELIDLYADNFLNKAAYPNEIDIVCLRELIEKRGKMKTLTIFVESDEKSGKIDNTDFDPEVIYILLMDYPHYNVIIPRKFVVAISIKKEGNMRRFSIMSNEFYHARGIKVLDTSKQYADIMEELKEMKPASPTRRSSPKRASPRRESPTRRVSPRRESPTRRASPKRESPKKDEDFLINSIYGLSPSYIRALDISTNDALQYLKKNMFGFNMDTYNEESFEAVYEMIKKRLLVEHCKTKENKDKLLAALRKMYVNKDKNNYNKQEMIKLVYFAIGIVYKYRFQE